MTDARRFTREEIEHVAVSIELHGRQVANADIRAVPAMIRQLLADSSFETVEALRTETAMQAVTIKALRAKVGAGEGGIDAVPRAVALRAGEIAARAANVRKGTPRNRAAFALLKLRIVKGRSACETHAAVRAQEIAPAALEAAEREHSAVRRAREEQP